MKMVWKLAILSTACSLLLLAAGCGGGSSSTSTSSSSGSNSGTSTDDGDSGTTDSGSSSDDDSSSDGDSTSATTTSKKSASGSGPQPKAVGGDPASKWGSLKGRFVFDGDAPTAAKLSITKDQEVCGKADLVDESLAVSEDGGLANVVLFLYLKRGDDAPEAHPDYATAAATVELDNKDCRFEPHICLLQTSQTLVVKNSDPVGHNTKVDSQANPAMNPIIPAGGTHEQTFTEAERGPVPVSCSIHPWMTAHLLVRDNPYFAVSDASGNFEIKNLPAGDWTFQVWHEKGNISEVTANGETGEWSRGRFDVTIEPGAEMDFGDIKVPASAFN